MNDIARSSILNAESREATTNTPHMNKAAT